jgi:uncharacterized protein (TIGR03382 family)
MSVRPYVYVDVGCLVPMMVLAALAAVVLRRR